MYACSKNKTLFWRWSKSSGLCQENMAMDGGKILDRYNVLLLELLRRLDEKADRLISLLEVGKDAENSGHNGADPGYDRQDTPQG